MNIVFMVHRVLGGLVLPILVLVAAIWFTIVWKPGVWPRRPVQLLRVLVGIQIALGLTYWIYLVINGAGSRFLSLPFLLHPVLGVLAAVTIGALMRPNRLTTRLARWAPLAVCGLALIIIVGARMVAQMA